MPTFQDMKSFHKTNCTREWKPLSDFASLSTMVTEFTCFVVTTLYIVRWIPILYISFPHHATTASHTLCTHGTKSRTPLHSSLEVVKYSMYLFWRLSHWIILSVIRINSQFGDGVLSECSRVRFGLRNVLSGFDLLVPHLMLHRNIGVVLLVLLQRRWSAQSNGSFNILKKICIFHLK